MKKYASKNGKPHIITQMSMATPKVNYWPQEEKFSHYNLHILKKRNWWVELHSQE